MQSAGLMKVEISKHSPLFVHGVEWMITCAQLLLFCVFFFIIFKSDSPFKFTMTLIYEP